MTSLERHIEIITPDFTYSGSMTRIELRRHIEKYNLVPSNIHIENLTMIDFNEIEIMWEITKTQNETVLFK